MSTCDCCGDEVPVLEVIGNADQEPWQVCARCLHADLDEEAPVEACDVA